METFSLPGFDVEELVGFGGCGEVWRARSRATGELVALKRLRVGGTGMGGTGMGGDGDRQLRRDAALLATVRHEHVVRLHATVPTGDGLVLVLEFAEGGGLAGLLASRGRLTAGEVVAVVAPLAVALADVHGRGVVHGNITPANVLFDGSGKPLLSDLGVAALIGKSGGSLAPAPGFADPATTDGMSVAAADVHGLAAVCHAALSGAPPYRDGMLVPLRSVAAGVPPVLIEAIESAMNPEFRSRPDAAAFARALYAACTPRPVALESPAPVEPAPAPLARVEVAPPDAPSVAKARGDRGRRLRRHVRTSGRHASRVAARRLAMPLLAAGLLAAAVLVGVAWAGHDRSAAASAQAAGGGTSSDSSWLRVMSTLDEARDQAFADGDPDELVGVYVAGSPALTADRQTLGAMVDAGQRARDLGLTLVSVQVRAQTSTTVELLVRDTLPSYEIVDADGEMRRQPGRAERAWLVTLEAAGAGGSWRIATIDAA